MDDIEAHDALKSCLKHLRYAIAEAGDLVNDPSTQAALDSVKDAVSVVASRVEVYEARAKMAEEVSDARITAERTGTDQDITKYYTLSRAAKSGAALITDIPDNELVKVLRDFRTYTPVPGTLHSGEFVQTCDRYGMFTHVRMAFIDGETEVVPFTPFDTFELRVAELAEAHSKTAQARLAAGAVPAPENANDLIRKAQDESD